MKKLLFISIYLFTSFFAKDLLSSENFVAKVILLKGEARAKFPDGSVQTVVDNQSIPEGSLLQTSEKSFLKLIFIDKSQMNLGPNSKMVINAFPKSSAGIITLIKGQLRSQVTKDYMEMDDRSKSKLYIKTKTAAMGVRGTEFQVNYNPENSNSSLITFEGSVAMSGIDNNNKGSNLDQMQLEQIVSNEKSVIVNQGYISALNLNIADRAMLPTFLGATQFFALRKNVSGLRDASEQIKKQFRNPIPQGVPGNLFPSLVIKESASDKIEKNNANKVNPDGYYNNKTGEYKLPAGSIIDLNTVNIIPPPKNSVIDAHSNSYIVPENYGSINKENGDYIPPEGLKLDQNGKFILVDSTAYSKSQSGDPSQVPKLDYYQGTATKAETKESSNSNEAATLKLKEIEEAKKKVQDLGQSTSPRNLIFKLKAK